MSPDLSLPTMRFSAPNWQVYDPRVPESMFSECVRHALRRLRNDQLNDDLGDYLEFGVGVGASLVCTYRVLMEEGLDRVRLFGFGSFDGLPPEAADEGYTPGTYYAPLPVASHYISDAGVDPRRVSLIKGWFKDTLTEARKSELGISRVSVVLINSDLCSSARSALAFVEPLIGPSAVVVFPDWPEAVTGQAKAFHEFVQSHPELKVESLPSYSGARFFFLKR